MKIALLGTRGVPASYSGFETCAEELGSRLVQRGHEVTVYCRSHHIRYTGTHYKGMRLVKLPTIQNKYLDTIVHSLLSSLHALTQGYDIALYFIAGNSPVTWIPRLVRQKTVLNVDGLDWKREKWPLPAKRYLRFAERLATFVPNAFLTDSKVVQRYYQEQFGVCPPYIAYGAEVEPLAAGETLKQFGLEPRNYILFVGRLVPENCVHHLVEAFKGLQRPEGMKCVIVGDAAYQKEYIRSLKAIAGEDVIFTGYVFGEGYRELNSNAYCFVETSGVGGTHPALLEAMGFGNCVVTHETPENLETLGSVGYSYDGGRGASSLRNVLQTLLDYPEKVEAQRERSRAYVREQYSWETITDQYLALFHQVLAEDTPPHKLLDEKCAPSLAAEGTKQNVLGVLVNPFDYQTATNRILDAARARRGLSVSALAVHGVMTGALDPTHRYRLNHLDLVLPDGQPVRWALNWLHRASLKDRVYGPTLMLKVCEQAAEAGLPIYLYGSQPSVLEALANNLRHRFPKLIIAGTSPSRFRQVSDAEKAEIANNIRQSGAAITFVGLGCPRQETWVYEYRDTLSMPLLAVGAAFDFHAGTLSQAPKAMQNWGLEWLYRLMLEPSRLWRRYLLLNPLYLWMLLLQALGVRHYDPSSARRPEQELRYG